MMIARVRRAAAFASRPGPADDRDEEAERLARAGARRDDVALALRGERDRLLLVLVEGERRALDLEDLCAVRGSSAPPEMSTSEGWRPRL
jgi:hypothetical protein